MTTITIGVNDPIVAKTAPITAPETNRNGNNIFLKNSAKLLNPQNFGFRIQPTILPSILIIPPAQVTTPLQAQELDIDNPKIYQMTFMALYNLDKFRDFIFKSSFLDRFVIDDVSIEKLKRSDVELLKFAFDWVKFGIFGQKTLQIKEVPQNNNR